MPFDNFYEESDKANRRWRKCFGPAFRLFAGYRTFALSAFPDVEDDRNPAEYLNTKASDEKERARRVDDLCRYLPLPSEFCLPAQRRLTKLIAANPIIKKRVKLNV